MPLAKSSNTANVENGFVSENRMRIAHQLQYAPSKEIVTDENGVQVKGTALLIYQGSLHSTIDWSDAGVNKSVAKLAFVFATRGIDGTFKNVAQKCPYGWVEGNDLDLMIKGIGGQVAIEKLSQTDNELFGDDYGLIVKLDYPTTNESLESLRGKAYTAVVERKISKKGAYYYEIDSTTLTPRLNKAGEHIQAQKASETNPNAVFIDWED